MREGEGDRLIGWWSTPAYLMRSEIDTFPHPQTLSHCAGREERCCLFELASGSMFDVSTGCHLLAEAPLANHNTRVILSLRKISADSTNVRGWKPRSLCMFPRDDTLFGFCSIAPPRKAKGEKRPPEAFSHCSDTAFTFYKGQV